MRARDLVPRRSAAAGALLAAGFGLVLVSLAGPGRASVRDDALEAAFLYRFASLTTWPESAFAAGDAAFVIGVAGAASSFAEALESYVAGKRVQGHPVEVKRLSDEAVATPCHVLYLPSESSEHIGTWLRSVRDTPVLTVSDAASFAESGGIIELDRREGKIQFSINRAAALDSDLGISSRLLRLAVQVIEVHAH